MPFREGIPLPLVFLTPYFYGRHTWYARQKYDHLILKANKRDSLGVDVAVVYDSE